MPTQKLRDYLDAQHVKYVSIRHSQAFTTQEVAASTHIKGKEMAKTVMIKVDGKLAMAVLPAYSYVDLDHLKDLTGARTVALATEREFREMFPDCEAGAMPPFGNLYGMDVYAAPKLAEDAEIAYNAGSHPEVVRMSWKDYERLVQPKIVQFALNP